MQLLNHTHEQQQVLLKLYQDLTTQLIAFTFAEPNDDIRELRRFAYIKGKWEIIGELLRDEWPDPVPPEETNQQPSGE